MLPIKVMPLLLTGITPFVILPGAVRAAEPQIILAQFQSKDQQDDERRKKQQQQQQQPHVQDQQHFQQPRGQEQQRPQFNAQDQQRFQQPRAQEQQRPQFNAQDQQRFQQPRGQEQQHPQFNAQEQQQRILQQRQAQEQQHLLQQKQAQEQQQKALDQRRALELKHAEDQKALEAKKAQQLQAQQKALDQQKLKEHGAGHDQHIGAPSWQTQGGTQPDTAGAQHQQDLLKQPQDARAKALEDQKLRVDQAKALELQQQQRQGAHELQLEKHKETLQQQQAGQQQTVPHHELSAEEQKLKAEREAHRFDRERLIEQQRQSAASEKSQAAVNERLKLQNERFHAINSQRREIVDPSGHRIIQEPGNRTIFRGANNQAFIRHDESENFRLYGGNARSQRTPSGNTISNIYRPDGSRVEVEVDSYGRPIRRVRYTREGKRFVLFENRALAVGLGIAAVGALAIALPSPRVDIPREEYIVDAGRASEDDIYGALEAPPVEALDRTYTLDEVLTSGSLRDRLRSVNIDTVNFDFGSWEVGPQQAAMLESVAAVLRRITNESPGETFLVEGHTDAVGSEEDNLSLSDRRAQAVADVLSQQFGVPRENLVTQGYGKQFLLIQTNGPERRNRRVVVRRLTPLLQGDNNRVSSAPEAPEGEARQ